ncbi:hypothetical protein B4168_1555 [Anoxybacillus flavithermus]|nr:hypothetical protein B4168_1555 [Anoxybacillus flavithermus]
MLKKAVIKHGDNETERFLHRQYTAAQQCFKQAWTITHLSVPLVYFMATILFYLYY